MNLYRQKMTKSTDHKDDDQKQRFITAAQESSADMSKEEFGCVIGKLSKSKKVEQGYDQIGEKEKHEDTRHTNRPRLYRGVI